MTKRISALLLALLLVCSSVICISAASAHPDRVCDYANLLTDSEEASLRQYFDSISTSHNCDVAVITIDSIGSATPQEAAEDMYDYNGYGLGVDRSGVLLLLVMDTRDWWITTTGFGTEACTDDGIDNIGDNILSYLSSDSYYKAFNKFAEICDDYYTQAESVISTSTASAHPDRVCDYADLLTDSEEASLRQYFDSISTSHNCDVAVITVDSIGSATPQDAADDMYDYNGYGLGDDHSGVMLLLVMDTRDWWITTTGFGIEACTDAGIDNIGDNILSYLSSGSYYKAFNKFAEICDDYYTRAENGTPYDVSNYSEDTFTAFKFTWVILAVVIAVIVAFIAVTVMKGQLKSVRFKASASDYVTPDSLRISEQGDFFLYSHVSRVARPKETSSSSSSGGSSTHTSSSGTSHGGGGGKF